MNELDIYAHIINDLSKNHGAYYVITVKLIKRRGFLLWLYDKHSYPLSSVEQVKKYLNESIYPAIDIVTKPFYETGELIPHGYCFDFTHKHAKMLGIYGSLDSYIKKSYSDAEMIVAEIRELVK